MTDRERFLATARFQPVDRTFLLAPWVWSQTRLRWQSEGLPPGANLAEYFRTDRITEAMFSFHNDYGVPILLPPFERQVLSRTAEYEVFRDETGTVLKRFQVNPMQSMPEWLEYPMKDRRDWQEKIKPRLQADTPGRIPRGAELDQYAESVRHRDYPLGVWAASFYGWPRCLMGVEQLSYLIYDDPALIHEICEYLADFRIALLTPMLQRVQFDFAFIWEDMAGGHGPLCSPAVYREFMLPPLKRVTRVLHDHGIDLIFVDSDGNNDLLIPLWLESGVNGLRPYEIAAGCDPVAARRQYGRQLIIQGGLDKRVLARDRSAIEREILSKVPWLCLQGGYFPQIDHLVPPDVPLENYRHYAQFLCWVVKNPEDALREARRRGDWLD